MGKGDTQRPTDLKKFETNYERIFRMPLDGVSKLCQKCEKDCKQFKQVKVISCPNFEGSPETTSEICQTG